MVTCLPELILRALVKCKGFGQTDGQSSYDSIDYTYTYYYNKRISLVIYRKYNGGWRNYNLKISMNYLMD